MNNQKVIDLPARPTMKRELHLALYGMLLAQTRVLDLDERLACYEQLKLSWHEQLVAESAFFIYPF